MEKESVIVLDFGGQYNQLIARRVRECNVYCEVKPYTMSLEEIKKINPKGIIFTGGPNSVYDEKSPHYDKAIFELGIPILGICYGSQLMAWSLGGTVETAPTSEYGHTEVEVDTEDALFEGVSKTTVCWMSHTDYIAAVPQGFRTTAHTSVCPTAAMECAERRLYAVQFHPEVNHTEHGSEMLKSFLFKVCGCVGDWTMESFAQSAITSIREKVGNGKVLLALSGGVDSSVCAALLSKAIGSQLTCIFVDHGLMRKNEGDEVEAAFADSGVNFVRVNAGERFLGKLAGVTEPEAKRKIIGEEFIRVFEEDAKKIGKVDYLVQGTIYPDVIESGLGDAAVIKSHHNVGGLPDYVDFKEIIEPLRLLFKDEVRALGTTLGLDEKLVWRQPFPGPGLGVRCLGAITRDRLNALREADAILREEFDKNGLAGKVWQYFIAVPDFKSVGVRDGKRYEGWPAIIRAVNTTDAMTATIEEIPYALLHHITDRITHEVEGINRVVMDLTPKPIGTIEWE